MNYKTGDKVRFLNEVGEGHITGFQNNNIALVEMEDGFEIPMKLSELVKIENDGTYDSENDSMKQTVATQDTVDPDTPDQVSMDKDSGIYFALVEAGIDHITLNLINDTDYLLQYLLCKSEDDNVSYINSGQLEDNTKIIINTLSSEQLGNIEFITFQGVLYSKKMFELQDPVNKTIDIKNIAFQSKAYIENNFFDEKALVIKLENEDLSKEINKLSDSEINAIIIAKEEKKIPSVGDFLKKKKQKTGNEIEEVDLHIESIIDDHYNMSPGEIINAQLSRFEIALTGAIRNNQRRIIFIHGVGNGKLKYEMSKILDRKYPDLIYQDASFKEYGYGAMMVIIK